MDSLRDSPRGEDTGRRVTSPYCRKRLSTWLSPEHIANGCCGEFWQWIRRELWKKRRAPRDGWHTRAVSKVRILYLIGTLELGGAERQLAELAQGLDPERFEARVCCLSRGGPIARTLEDKGIRVEILGLQRARIRRHPWEALAGITSLVGSIRSMRPDVLHCYLYAAYVTGAFAGTLAGVPAIVAGRRSLGRFKEGKLPLLGIERVANALTDLLIANSFAVRADVLRQERVARHKVEVIYNGIEASRYAIRPDPALRRELGLISPGPVVSVVANFIDYKGHEYFLDAWSNVIRAIPEAVALLVGDGPCRTALEAQARRVGIEASTRFLGQRQDVPEILALTDVFVHPSLEEGFCNAILEAMAAGKPVVATFVGGNPEAILDGTTGILVPPRDSRTLGDALIGLLRNPGRAMQMGVEGRERVRRSFDLNKMIAQYERAYLELLTKKGVDTSPEGHAL